MPPWHDFFPILFSFEFPIWVAAFWGAINITCNKIGRNVLKRKQSWAEAGKLIQKSKLKDDNPFHKTPVR